MNSNPVFSLFSSHSATTAERQVSLAELARMANEPPVYTTNAAMPVFAPHDGSGKTKAAAECATFWAVLIDHDDDNRTAADIRQLYGPDGLDVAYLAFTTSSHQRNVNKLEQQCAPLNKWKVVIPLAEPLAAKQWLQLAQGITQYIGADVAQARAQQIAYIPCKLAVDAPYDLINGLDSAKPLQPSDQGSVFVQKAAEGLAALQKEQAATLKPESQERQQAGGVVELISQAYDLAGLLLQHDYKRRRNNLYLSPYSSSGAAGVHILTRDGKQVVYSHHGTDDPLSKDNHGGHSLDVVDVLCCLKYGGDFGAMVHTEAQMLDPKGQKERQKQHMQEQQQTAAEMFADVAEQPTSTASVFTRFVDFDVKPKPPDWVIPEFIAEGLAVIAGGHGVGKTTALLPLALAVAGVHAEGYPLAPEHWRHVVYITEDVEQARRIVAGYVGSLDCAEAVAATKERLHVVEAIRKPVVWLTAAGPAYRQLARTVTTTGDDGQDYIAELLPLVVIDTHAATIEMENENDNSGASEIMAALKQGFAGLPVWVVGHTAKSNLSQTDGLTMRGASAFEGDAYQVLYLVKDEQTERRYLKRGKTRFEAEWPELELLSSTTTRLTLDRFGRVVELTLRWAVATPPDASREQVASLQARHLLWLNILVAVMEAEAAGEPLNRTGVRHVVRGSTDAKTHAVNSLIKEGLLVEKETPKELQQNGNQKRCLVIADAERVQEYLNHEKPPAPPELQKTAKEDGRGPTAKNAPSFL